MSWRIELEGLKYYQKQQLEIDPEEKIQKKTKKFLRFYWRTIVFFFVIFFPFLWLSIYLIDVEFKVDQPPGMLVKVDPVQTPTGEGPWLKDDHRFIPVAEYAIRGRVLGRERYTYSRGAEIAPFDLGLGWGPMSDTDVLSKLKISQSFRYMDIETTDERIPAVMINKYSSNNHIIPADEDVNDVLKTLVTGQIIEITGYLVNVEKDGSRVWKTSDNRDDKGHGACEVIWVSSLRVLDPSEYKPHTKENE